MFMKELSASCSLRKKKKNWSLHLFLGRPIYFRPFGLYCNACFGNLFVSILCTCCSHFFWYWFISFTIKIRSNIQIMELLCMEGGRNSGIDITTRWTARGSNPVWEEDFLFATPVQNSSGAQPESCTMNTKALSWGKSGGGVWRLSLTPV
jgi:hypothetical protein